MAQSIPTAEPAFLQAGDTVKWRRALADYPASAGWVLAYRLINAAVRIDITAEAAGDDHLVTVPASTSAAWAAGDYTWTAFVTKDGERYTVGKGSTVIRPDLAALPEGFDARSPARKALEDLRAALRTWLSTNGHVQEYEVAGRRVRFASADDLRTRIAIAAREATREEAAERLAAGLPSRRRVLVRF